MKLRWRNKLYLIWTPIAREIMQLQQNKLPSVICRSEVVIVVWDTRLIPLSCFMLGCRGGRLECSIVCQNNNYPLECSWKLLKRANNSIEFVFVNGKYRVKTHPPICGVDYTNMCSVYSHSLTWICSALQWNMTLFIEMTIYSIANSIQI